MIATTRHIDMVKEFNQMFGFETKSKLTKESLGFRIKLLMEEINELTEEIKKYNKDKINKSSLAKEIADVDYIISGTILIFNELKNNNSYIYELPNKNTDYFVKHFQAYSLFYKDFNSILVNHSSSLNKIFDDFADLLNQTIDKLNQFILLEFNKDTYSKVFEIVHHSNINKYYNTLDEAKKYIKEKSTSYQKYTIYFSEILGLPTSASETSNKSISYYVNNINRKTGGFFIKNDSGKLMKPLHYVSPINKIQEIL